MKVQSGIFIFLFMILASITAPSFACKGSQVLFQDNFDKLDPAWGSAGPQESVSNNTLLVTPDLNKSYVILNGSNLFKDMDYCVDVKLEKGDASTYGAGLAFWGTDYNDYYFFYITGGGNYFVGRYAGNNRNIYPIPSTKSDAINTAKDAVNHLRVVTQGSKATVYINDKEVNSFTGQPPQGGGLIGVAGDSSDKVKNTWGFSNIKITNTNS